MRTLKVSSAKKLVREGWNFRLSGEKYLYAFPGHKIGPEMAEFSKLGNGVLTYYVFRLTPAAEEYLRQLRERQKRQIREMEKELEEIEKEEER